MKEPFQRRQPEAGQDAPIDGADEARPDDGLPMQVDKGVLVLIMVALCAAVFCQSLDTTIIATAIPRITDEFNSLRDVGWYGGAYLLANCASLLVYGKLYNLWPVQWVFLGALSLFEIGSIVCAAAPTSIGLIMGRVIAGIGSGGILSGSVLIIANTVPLRHRPIYNGLLGTMYAISSVAGPLLGGAFTQYVTWRLCFWINVPLGLFSGIVIVFFLRKLKAPPRASLALKEKMLELDLPGISLFLPCIVCLLLAIQWGGVQYPWSSGRVVALLVLFGVLGIAFIGVQAWQKDRAIVPLSIVKLRTIWSCTIFYFFLFGSLLVFTYYLPLWFQAVKGNSASQSGIYTLPLMCGSVILSIATSIIVTWVGYYTWACITSSILASVGAGLMTIFAPASSAGYWIGFQALYGAGTGLGLQQPLIAVQAVLPEELISEGTAFVIFVSTVGGSIFLSVAQNLFISHFSSGLRSSGLPVDANALSQAGATDLEKKVAPDVLPQVRSIYNDAVIQAFYVAVATAALSAFGSALIPWINIKKVQSEKDAARASAAGDSTHVDCADSVPSVPTEKGSSSD